MVSIISCIRSRKFKGYCITPVHNNYSSISNKSTFYEVVFFARGLKGDESDLIVKLGGFRTGEIAQVGQILQIGQVFQDFYEYDGMLASTTVLGGANMPVGDMDKPSGQRARLVGA